MNVLFVGQHAKILNEENGIAHRHSLTFENASIHDNSMAVLRLDALQKIFLDAYEIPTLKLAIQSMLHEALPNEGCIVFGDPSELYVNATLRALMDASALIGCVFIYPVGMSALDMRKELSSLILELKRKEIPTYLARNPVAFFETFEPNLEALVYGLENREIPNVDVEYLCGKGAHKIHSR